MQIIDIIALLLIAIGLINGFMKGIVNQLFVFAGYAAGLVVANLFYDQWGRELAPIMGTSDYVGKVVVFVAVLLIVPLLFSIAGALLTKLLKAIKLGIVNRVAGALLGAALAALVLGTLFNLAEMADPQGKAIAKTTRQSSLLYYPIQRHTHFVFKGVNELLAEKGTQLIEQGLKATEE